MGVNRTTHHYLEQNEPRSAVRGARDRGGNRAGLVALGCGIFPVCMLSWAVVSVVFLCCGGMVFLLGVLQKHVCRAWWFCGEFVVECVAKLVD